ncbi:hypothetical protein [Curtobacterium sp. B18]|uniref:hypothetical protein n=1 Tax=Curtobacterium sp. B18 TaxID=95614 RepID=UPI0003B4C21D|nr:hypothetical protein [Curtobacterium sp. B18]
MAEAPLDEYGAVGVREDARFDFEDAVGELHPREDEVGCREVDLWSAVGELERLAGFHQSGVLTDEEFTSAKRKPLGF